MEYSTTIYPKTPKHLIDNFYLGILRSGGVFRMEAGHVWYCLNDYKAISVCDGKLNQYIVEGNRDD
jgi:hypothetical protein